MKLFNTPRSFGDEINDPNISQYRGAFPYIKLFAQKLIPKHPGSILHLGCGKQRFHTYKEDMFNVDILPPCNLQCDLNQYLPFKSESFNGIITLEVIEHLENPFFFLRECFRVAHDWIILSTPNPQHKVGLNSLIDGWNGGHRSFMPYSHLWSYAIKNGWHIVNSDVDWPCYVVKMEK